MIDRDDAMPLLIALVALSGVAVGATLTNTIPTSGSAAFQTNSDVSVVVDDPGGEVNATFPDNNTVDIATANGNVTVSGSAQTNVTIDRITGEWTNVSQANVVTDNVTINPEDKDAVSIGGNVDNVSFRDVSADDGVIDVRYAGASGTTTLILRGLPTDRDILLVDTATGEIAANGNTGNSGTLAATGLNNSDHTLLVQTQSGGPGISNPTPEGPLSSTPTQLTADIDDPDFEDTEKVNVTFELDGTEVGTDTLTSAGTASTSIAAPSRGDHTVVVTATDAANNTNTLTYEFATPENLTVRRASAPHQIIDDRTVTATFVENGDTIETRQASNGVIDMAGLATGPDIVMQINASATSGSGVPNRSYYASEYIVEDITSQQTVFLIDQNNSIVESRFTLNDRTSKFEGNGAQLQIQRAINISGSLKFRTVHSDEFGVEGVTTELIAGERYRLVVKNADDDMRVLGSYDADVSETVPLTVGTVSAEPEDPDLGFEYNVTRVRNSQGTLFAKVGYNDNASLTDSVTVEIFERGNRSKKLVNNQTFSGPLGSFILSEEIPPRLNSTSFVAVITVNRDGGTETIRLPFGPRQPVLGGMAPWLRATISIGSLFLVAGLFSQINGRIGGLVVAGLGGIFFFVDFLPDETGIGVVVLSMVTAGILFIKERIV